jgi:glycosyltransferase involved in cell wall biosynthesis
MTNDDLVSIGMPVYNGEKYLESSIRANLAQTYDNFELIISDNASQDKTESICRDYAQMDERIRYVRNDANIGAAQNYNKLFDLAEGPFFRWSNADDLVRPQLLERTLEVLKAHPDVVIAYGRTQLIDADGGALGEYDDNLDIRDDSASRRFHEFYKRVRLTNVIYGLMRASAVARTQIMGDGKLPAGDISFMSAMILQGKFAGIPEVLFERRMHESAFSANPDPDMELAFWSGGHDSHVTLPHWREEVANIGAIWRAPEPVNEKLKLLSYQSRRFYWRRRFLARDVVRLFRNSR